MSGRDQKDYDFQSGFRVATLYSGYIFEESCFIYSCFAGGFLLFGQVKSFFRLEIDFFLAIDVTFPVPCSLLYEICFNAVGIQYSRKIRIVLHVISLDN